MYEEEPEMNDEVLGKIKLNIDVVTLFLLRLSKHFGLSLDCRKDFYYLPDTTVDEASIVQLAGWLTDVSGSNMGRGICDSIASFYQVPYNTVIRPSLN